jgi:hypothetical protein
MEIPRWIRLVAFVPAAGVLGFGAAGLLLVVFGVYTAPLAFALGAVAFAGLLALAWPALTPTTAAPATRSAHVAAAVAVAAVLAITAWNGAHASQHVMINRDGGAYTEEGRWIARHGELSAPTRVGPFGKEPKLEYWSSAIYDMNDGEVQYQFAHLLPTLLAESYAIAGDRGLFHAPEILGGVSLLAFFVLAWKLLKKPWFALGAMLALAFLIPQISFSRDSYSEIPSQILLFTAMGLLTTTRAQFKVQVALAAGLFLGALECTRIDAIVFLIGVWPFLAVFYLCHRRSAEERKYALTRIGAFIAGLVPGMTLGLVDLMHHSGSYYNDLSSNVHMLFKAAGASFVLSVIAALVWPFLTRIKFRLPMRPVAAIAGVFVAIAGFATWALRPHFQTMHADPIGLTELLQRQEGLAVDRTRAYYERSLEWMQWYLGPITLAAAIIGAGLLAAAVLRGKANRTLGCAAILGPATLLYLWKAEAVPDHVWVTRRFLVSAFPSLVLVAFGLMVFLFTRRGNGALAVAARVAAIALGVIAVAYPIHAMWDVRNMTEQRGFLNTIHQVCNSMDDHPAVLVLEKDKRDLIDEWAPQAIRGWCNADVAIMRGTPDPAVVARLADGWAAEGRQFYLVGAANGPFDIAAPNATVVTTDKITNNDFLARSLTHRPNAYATESMQMAVARVAPSG